MPTAPTVADEQPPPPEEASASDMPALMLMDDAANEPHPDEPEGKRQRPDAEAQVAVHDDRSLRPKDPEHPF